MSASLDLLCEFLRFQSISADPAYRSQTAACADWLAEVFRSMGLETTVWPTDGHPVVTARSTPRPGLRTVLIYGHYDVQPPDPLAEWSTPPFEPVVKEGAIYARGSADNKGQIMAHLLGVKAALEERGELPVNVIFLVEGEEEVGSKHLEAFLTAHRDWLKPNVIVISDAGMAGPGQPSITYGMRGLVAMEVRLRGAVSDLHSGSFGGVAPNPALLLSRLLATLHDDDFRIAVPGFYDGVRSVEAWERAEWAKLPDAEGKLLEQLKIPELVGESAFSAQERLWGRPTAEVNGIGGGYQGEGGKTVIPREAFAKLTFRLVPDQKPEEIVAKVRAHLEAHCPAGVTLEVIFDHSGEPFLSNPNSPDGLAARRALKAVFCKEPVLIRGGGSIPIMADFCRILESEILLIGLAQPGCRTHAPDEHFLLDHFERGILMNQALLQELSLSSSL